MATSVSASQMRRTSTRFEKRASTILGLLLTVLGGFVAARLANELHIQHGIAVGIAALLVWLFVDWVSPPGGVPGWYDLISFIAVLPAGALGGYLARWIMSKISKRSRRSRPDDLRDEYRLDYRKSRPNRFACRIGENAVAVVLEPDVAQVFESSESVNQLLGSVGRAASRTEEVFSGWRGDETHLPQDRSQRFASQTAADGFERLRSEMMLDSRPRFYGVGLIGCHCL